MRRAFDRVWAAVQPVFLLLHNHRQNALLRRQVTVVERKATEQAAFTQAVIDHMVTGLVVTTEDATIDSVNPAAERLFGAVSEDLVGRPLGELMPAFATQTPVQVLGTNQILAVGGVMECEVRLHSGRIVPVEMALYGFPTSSGRRFAVSVRDVSERHALERLKHNFVSMVSHELRTPLTSIHGSLRLLRGGALGPVTKDTDLAVKIAERNTARLLSLINDILDCERLDAGQNLQVAPVAVATLVGQAIESVQLLAEQKAVALERPDVSGTIHGDADRLVQVLVNLLANAINFSPRHGVVTIAAAERFGWVEVTVRDRGRGIPADQRALVFEPFHQVDASDTRARGGSGLGLAICRRIVDRHHGAIGVESVEGEGSTFWFRIPAAPAVAAEPARRQIAFAAGSAR